MLCVEYKPISLDLLNRYKAIRLWALREDPAAFGSTYAREAAFDEAEWRQRCERMGAGVDGCGWIAFLDDEAVGLIGVFDFGEPGEVMIVSMWVAPEARRQGVASGLIDHALAWARARPRTTRVTLHVGDFNTDARRLYERHGFMDTGERMPHPNLPDHEECLMVLEIAGA